MDKQDILNKLIGITYQPFLVFASKVGKKSDNAFETLYLLANETKVTAGRIAEYLDIKPSSVTQIIKKLEDAKTAIRVKSEDDARITFVEITDKGRESIKDRGAISTNLCDELFKGLDENELVMLDSYLTRIDENVCSAEFQAKLDEIFNDDHRWKHFSKMSAHLGKAREQMLERDDFAGFRDFGEAFSFERKDNFFKRGRK